MPNTPKRSARDEALHRHWDAERREFGLKPWQRPPCMVSLDDPDPDWGPEQGADWNHARALRRAILARDPDHYRDMEPARRRKK